MAFSTASKPPFSKKLVPSCVDGLLDGVQTSLLQKVGAVLRGCNPITAEVISDRVVLLSVDRVAWVLDGLAVLLVELLHLYQLAMITAIIGDELCGDSDWLGAVDLEVGSWTKEIVDAQPVWLDVATVLVAEALEAILTVVTAVSAVTAGLLTWRARVHGVSSSHLVCLPQVNLCAATSVLASACVLVCFTWDPLLHVGLTVDELQVMGALGIAVTETHLGAGVAVLGFATIGIHLHKVQGTIQTTIQIGVIHGVGELLVFQLEKMVSVVILHQEGA